MYPDEIEIGLFCPLHPKSQNIINDHFWRFLVFFLQRDETRHILWHVNKTCVEFATATTDDIYAQADGLAVPRCLKSLEETTTNLLCLCYRFIDIAKK